MITKEKEKVKPTHKSTKTRRELDTHKKKCACCAAHEHVVKERSALGNLTYYQQDHLFIIV